jgi:hypothetical protein
MTQVSLLVSSHHVLEDTQEGPATSALPTEYKT